MNNMEYEFTMMCLENISEILKCPKKLEIAKLAFTKGDMSHPRYQCNSKLTTASSWEVEELTDFTAAYSDAIFQTLDFFQQKPEVNIQELLAAQTLFEETYIPAIAMDTQADQRIVCVLRNIEQIKTQVTFTSDYFMISEHEADDMMLIGDLSDSDDQSDEAYLVLSDDEKDNPSEEMLFINPYQFFSAKGAAKVVFAGAAVTAVAMLL